VGDVVNFPVLLDSDLGRELIVDCVRFAEGLLDERAIRKKYRFDDSAWEALGSNDALVEAIEVEKTRRIRNGDTKREKAQMLVTRAPDVLSGILLDSTANARHRIDSAKTLNEFASNGPGQSAPASDRFVIQINLGSDTLRFDKSRAIDPSDVDPNDVGTTPQELLPVIAANKRKDDDQW
jgi:hypothetical protein